MIIEQMKPSREIEPEDWQGFNQQIGLPHVNKTDDKFRDEIDREMGHPLKRYKTFK